MSCSDVCVVMEADAHSEFYREQERRAAKPYSCDECAEPIAKGDRYHYAAGKCDGDFYDARTCLQCHEIRTTFACNGWVFGALWESVHDQLFSVWDDMKAIDCLARLKTQAAIDKMRQKYAAYVADQDE